MPIIDELEDEINNLNEDTSDIVSFKRAYRHIEEALSGISEGDKERLKDIITKFRNTLPDMTQLKLIRVNTKSLDEKLKLNSIADTIKNIKNRNQATTNLSEALNEQSKKATRDAALLNRITDALEKANKTVAEVKSLIDTLQDSDASAKTKLKGLVDAVDNVSGIFKPQTT